MFKSSCWRQLAFGWWREGVGSSGRFSRGLRPGVGVAADRRQWACERLGAGVLIFALALGLFISNVIGLPDWMREAVRTEFYIKTGLVILGSGILFGDILRVGRFGPCPAFAVVTCVWFFSFWLGRKLHLDDESPPCSLRRFPFVASRGDRNLRRYQGDQRKLSYVTSLVLIVAVPMMIAMPWIIERTGIPQMVGGAWLEERSTPVARGCGRLIGWRGCEERRCGCETLQNVLIEWQLCYCRSGGR